jgi:AraC-like DNA-binding protein
MNPRLFLSIILFCLCTFSSFAQDTSAEEQALLDKLETLSGDEKMNTIFHLSLLHEGEEKMLYYTDMMEEYARQINDEYYTGSALLLRATYYFNWGSGEDFLHHAAISRDYHLSHDDLPRYLATEAFIIAWHIETGKYETALRIIDEMLKVSIKEKSAYGEMTAYDCMGDVYAAGRYYDKAFEAYIRSYALIEKWDAGGQMHKLDIGTKVVGAAYHAGEYDKVREYCDKIIALEGALKEDDTELGAQKGDDYTKAAYAYCAMLHVRQGETDKALEYLQAADTLNHSIESFGQLLNIAYAMYYSAIGQYDKALRYVEQTIEYNSAHDYIIGYIDALTLKSEIENQVGSSAAYTTLKEAGRLADSLAREQLAVQLSELRTIYQVEKVTAEKTRNRNYFLFALGGCVLLLLLLSVAFYYNRIITAKNRRLYAQIKEQDRLSEEMERNYAMALSSRDGHKPAGEASEDLPGDHQQRELVARLKKYLLSQGSLALADLGRDELIAALGTNKNILSEAVRAVTGKTPMEYLCFLQLEEARRMIDSHPELTVEAIAGECGFNTPSTFYRAFRRQYGITPAEYRRMAAAGD